MMDISHLYHDAAFGDPTLELDVKEQLKTREINAREERNLQRVHQSYERAKCICEKNTAWERWKVGQSLSGIWERSPHMEKRLAVEKARIEALERNILYRNYRMGTNLSNASFNSRSLSSVSLKPLQDKRKVKPKRKDRTKKEDEENEGNGNSERSIARQADFVRRSEHSIKALAKLNWKQQNRRRDHEKFKEELFFHSKPVIEKAKVVLKGRSDVNVDSLYTDFENILLPPVRKPMNLNSSFRPFVKHQAPSNLFDRNILHLSDSVERKSFSSELLPVTENSEAEERETAGRRQCTTGSTANEANVSKKGNDSQDNTDNRVSNSPQQSASLDDTDSARMQKNEPNQSPRLSHTSTSNTDNPTQHKTGPDSKTIEPIVSTPPQSSAINDSNSNESFSPDHVPRLPGLFSPSTSVSQVIIEEEEQDGELREKAPFGDKVSTDLNNNSIDDKGNGSMKSKQPSLYTLTCTVGLPKLWKQAVKTKEKPPAEISPAALGRKHRRKRKDW